MVDPRLQIVKKMNSPPGLPSRTSSVIIGNKRITKDAVIQLAMVE